VIQATGDGIRVDVLVQPRASRPRLGPVHGDRVKIAVTSPPVDGEANAAVIELLARILGVSRGAIEVVSGHTGRRKTIAIRGVDAATFRAALAP